jgi:hypothetical protein
MQTLAVWEKEQKQIRATDSIRNPIGDERKSDFLRPAHIERLRVRWATDLHYPLESVEFVPDTTIIYEDSEDRRAGWLQFGSLMVPIGVLFRSASSPRDQEWYSGVDSPGAWATITPTSNSGFWPFIYVNKLKPLPELAPPVQVPNGVAMGATGGPGIINEGAMLTEILRLLRVIEARGQ